MQPVSAAELLVSVEKSLSLSLSFEVTEVLTLFFPAHLSAVSSAPKSLCVLCRFLGSQSKLRAAIFPTPTRAMKREKQWLVVVAESPERALEKEY